MQKRLPSSKRKRFWERLQAIIGRLNNGHNGYNPFDMVEIVIYNPAYICCIRIFNIFNILK